MIPYASMYDLEDRLSSHYTMPLNADQLLEKASELIDEATLGRAQVAYDSGDDDTPADSDYTVDTLARQALARAVCDQVEFWIEVSETHDVAGLSGSLVAGRLQIHPVPNLLAVRARRTLRNAGLIWHGVAVL